MPETLLSKLSSDLDTACYRLFKKQEELNCYPDWRVRIVSELGAQSFSLKKDRGFANNGIHFEMPSKLLSAILNRKIHFNNALVGCHIQIHRKPNIYNPDISMLLCFFHV